MKLTNKQIDLIVGMIMKEVEPKKRKEIETKQKKLKEKIKSDLLKMKEVKTVLEILSNPIVQSVSLEEKVYCKIIGIKRNCYNTTVESLDDIVGKVFSNKNEDVLSEYNLRKEIEWEVLLSLLNADDINELIKSIVDKY